MVWAAKACGRSRAHEAGWAAHSSGEMGAMRCAAELKSVLTGAGKSLVSK